MAMLDGMDMHPEKKCLSKIIIGKEKQLKKKKKITSATIAARAKKGHEKATTEKSGFNEFLDESDLQ